LQFPASESGSGGTLTKNANVATSVRCIKNSCDEAPTNVRFTRDLPAVGPKGGIDTIRVSYQTFGPDTIVTWTSGNDIEIIDSTKTYAVLKHKTAGTFSWNSLSCTIGNDYGTTTITGSGEYEVIDGIGSIGASVTGTNTYQTWNFPGGLGRWTTEHLREEANWPYSTEVDNATYTFYDTESAADACNSLPGMRLAGKASLRFFYLKYLTILPSTPKNNISSIFFILLKIYFDFI
jgi:hypothetical protein